MIYNEDMISSSTYSLFEPSPWLDAGQILLGGFITSVILYFFIGWLLRFTGIEKLLHKLLGHSARIGSDPLPKALGKYISIFIFILFLRSAVEKSGYIEVEKFLDNVVNYIPYLLGAVFIMFLGIQTSRTLYTIVYNAVHFENPRTAYIIAYITRVIFLFFVFTIVINLVNASSIEIIPEYLVRSVLIGFVSSAGLAFGLAFGLGGRDAAAQIIHEYLSSKDDKEKNLKN